MAARKRVTYSSRPSHKARQVHARGAREFKTYDTSLIRPKQNRGPVVFAIVLCLVVALALLFGVASCSRGCSSAANLVAEGTEVALTVEQGAGASEIAQQLEENGLLAHASDFTKAVQEMNADTALKPGAYTIVGGTSAEDIVSMLTAGPPVKSFTVPEGLTAARTAQVVAEAYGGRITAADFMKCVNNASAFASEFPFVRDAYDDSLEGFLFPKTYDMDDDDTADSVVRKMLAQYRSEVGTLNYAYPRDAGLSGYDALILASVVEREASQSTRPAVASVFYNRLALGMPLQSDATVAYLVDGDPTPEDLEVDSPYNTYLNMGLPAGPICSPGIECLKAVCNPDQTDYLYFYFTEGADGTMEYSFSETFDEHQDVIAADIAAQQAAGNR